MAPLMTPLNIGVIGLGRAFTLMLPTFVHDSRVTLVAATDPIAAARAQFEADFNAPACDRVEALCANPQVQVVYVASPHQFHADHVCTAAAHGKHVLVEKPMALSLAECTRMIDACRSAGVHLIVGHSHSFNAPIRRCREIIESGVYGAVRMITAMNFTDFLYRPRRPEELMTSAGGGVIHSQAAHQIDIIRLLGGGLVSSVRAYTGAWDAARPTEGAYSALLGFEGGAFATATYSGYGHYDSDELMENTGELGNHKNPDDYGSARQRLAKLVGVTEDETALKAARNYGGSAYTPSHSLPNNLRHQHFGQLIVSCDKADLKPSATGVTIYTDTEKILVALPAPLVPRIEVIDEMVAAICHNQPPTHSGQWARATTAVCLAMLESAANQHECQPAYQVRAI
jgi:phthalate 4,5-cis-dihydrodiol dehydrogenase